MKKSHRMSEIRVHILSNLAELGLLSCAVLMGLFRVLSHMQQKLCSILFLWLVGRQRSVNHKRYERGLLD